MAEGAYSGQKSRCNLRVLGSIVKRDGRTEAFDPAKMDSAVRRCLANATSMTDGEAGLIAGQVSGAVQGILRRNGQEVTVEGVQRLVIQQLWALGQFDAAEHYTLYREERRKAREEKPIDPGYAAAVQADAARFPTPVQYYQFISKFARWRDRERRRETWREACDRVMGWFKGLPRVRLTEEEWAELDASLHGLETSCAMRVVQMAGPALERCQMGVYNCAGLPILDLRCFAEFLYVLMSGSGCSFSVEDEWISRLPRVKRQRAPAVQHRCKVADSTEGWCDALLFGLERWFDGEDVWFDVSGVREKNARLKVKGGRASGPGPFLELVAFARKLILSRQGRVLTDIDVHDLCCTIAKIVQVGGVRRAATLSHSDLNSQAMRECKSGGWYTFARQRTMANNSAVYDGRPDIDTFMAEFSALVRSRSGERGIFNRQAVIDHMPARRDKGHRFLTNPCGEILFRPFGLCNLSIVVARPGDTRESLRRKVRLATYWGCMQKTCTRFNYVRQEWHDNAEEEALLGVDITGHADCPLLRPGAPGRAELLRGLAAIVREVDVELSARFGVRESAANTCVKPSGDSAVFYNCASGVSPWFDRWFMRWVREPACSPVAKLLIGEGVPHAEAPEDPALMVFGFPRKAPAGAPTRHDMTALEQLENWLEWKRCWAEHSVSCTVYVDEGEWPGVMAWVWEHFDKISGLSFLPRDNGVYTYAPHEALTEAQCDEWAAKFPEINWAKLSRHEDDDQTNQSLAPACAGGSCEM